VALRTEARRNGSVVDRIGIVRAYELVTGDAVTTPERCGHIELSARRLVTVARSRLATSRRVKTYSAAVQVQRGVAYSTSRLPPERRWITQRRRDGSKSASGCVRMEARQAWPLSEARS
jgi:hypothetical protein